MACALSYQWSHVMPSVALCSWAIGSSASCLEPHFYGTICFRCLVIFCSLCTFAFGDVSSVSCRLQPSQDHCRGVGKLGTWGTHGAFSSEEPPGRGNCRGHHCALHSQCSQWPQMEHSSEELILGRSKSEIRQLIQRLQLTVHAGLSSSPACLWISPLRREGD